MSRDPKTVPEEQYAGPPALLGDELVGDAFAATPMTWRVPGEPMRWRHPGDGPLLCYAKVPPLVEPTSDVEEVCWQV